MSLPATEARRQAIDAAQQAARAQFLALRGASEARVIELLDELSNDIAQQLSNLANADGSLPPEAAWALDAWLNTRLQQFDSQWNGVFAELITQTIPAAAAIGGGASAGAIGSQVMTWFNAFVAADGLQLSDRLWRIRQSTHDTLSELIRVQIANGFDAARMADALIAQGRSVPADVLARIDAGRATSISQAVRDSLTGEAAPNIRFNLIRLLRTEANRAHTEAFVAGLHGVEGIAGVKFTLSPLHPRVDVCDLHAAVNAFGLGPGVYPLGQHPWPAHPMTLSYLQAVFVDEISEADRASQQSPFDWLRGQSSDMQRGVLGGDAKARAFRAGQLQPEDLRTPWKYIQPRLGDVP